MIRPSTSPRARRRARHAALIALLGTALPAGAQRTEAPATLEESLSLVSPAVLDHAAELGFRVADQILHETFTNNDRGWCTGKEDGDLSAVFRGRFLLEDADGSNWCRTEAPHDDALIRIEVAYRTGYVSNGAGVFFWNNGWDTPRPFILIDGAEEGGLFFQVGHFDRELPENQWVDAVPWEESELLEPGRNVVELIATEGALHVFLNGAYSRSVTGLPGDSGRYLGLLVAHSEMRYAFDDLVVLRLAPVAGGTR